MSKKPAEAFTVQNLETGQWVAVAFDSDDYAGMEDVVLYRLLDELEAALKLRRDIERGTSHRVEFLKREFAKTRPVYVSDDDGVEAETLIPLDCPFPAGTIGLRDGNTVPKETETMFVGANDDGVLNAGSGLDVSDGADARVDLLELAEEFSVFLTQATRSLRAADALDRYGPMSACDLLDAAGYDAVARRDLAAQVKNIQRGCKDQCYDACCE